LWRNDSRSTLAGAALGVVGGALTGAALASVIPTEAAFFSGYCITQGTLAAMASVQE
jgi:hypothetical protein